MFQIANYARCYSREYKIFYIYLDFDSSSSHLPDDEIEADSLSIKNIFKWSEKLYSDETYWDTKQVLALPDFCSAT